MLPLFNVRPKVCGRLTRQMDAQRAYSRRQWALAVNASAVLGWFSVVWPALLEPKILLPAAIIGLPIAFLACWCVAAPILWRIMLRPISWLGAIRWGSTISASIALVGIAIGRLYGWMESVNPDISSQIGGGIYVQEIDGILTPYGWLLLARNTIWFVLGGVAVALLIRGLIGRGSVVANR